MIKGIKITPLKQISDDRGKIMHMLRSTDPHFEKFGEVYFSWIYPKVIKAWQKHSKMTLNYAVPVGNVQVVVFDDRKESTTYNKLGEFYLGPENYNLLTIPSNVWYGFRSTNDDAAMIVNCSTIPHDPTEMVRIAPFDPLIPYSWK
jgi:dTDP-4-dehydrorhamnose 3,5-epimerase